MTDVSRYLAFIPARGGSKRLPGKNTVNFNGKPLIAWTIEAARKSQFIDEIIVSTDSQDIADISQRYGANVPNLRPKHLSGDQVSVVDVLYNYLETLDSLPQYVVVLQPTSPLRSASHIDDAISKMKHNDAIISVTKVKKPAAWSNTLPEDLSLSNFMDKSLHNQQSQEFETRFTFNGAMYICKTERLLSEKSLILSSKIVAYEMSYEESVDIDDETDLLIAKGVHMGISQALKKLDE